MPVRHRRSNRRRASRARNNISIASPPPGLGRRAPPRPTVERMISCSPVSFNDIKHLARSMPADGLEAQDVVPPRCGCWVAHIAIFSSRRSVFGQSTHARAPREISPEFSSAVRRPPVREFLMIWRAVFEALGSCSGRRGTGRQICRATTVWSGRFVSPTTVATRGIATYVAPNGRVARVQGTEVFQRI